tara:strand:+ start:3286 stop:4086 length:801 start_codon:yes stop_codon:yes gene_type:complete
MDNNIKKSSLGYTVIVHIILIILFCIIGLTYITPPPQPKGISINFGYSNTGKTNTQPEKNNKIKNIQKIQPIKKKNDVKNDIITQEKEKNPEIKKEKKIEKEIKQEDVKKEELREEPKEEAKEEPKEEKIIDEKLLYKGDKENSSTTQGDEMSNKDKGSEKGKTNTNDIKGEEGSGGKNINLGNRQALSLMKPTNKCKKEGIVVVKIKVNTNGTVYWASGGVTGSTIFDFCLIKEAEKAAKKTTFVSINPNEEDQIGTIIYHFKLK